MHLYPTPVVGDTAGVVGDAVDNEYVSTAANVVQEQAEADDDTTLIQRAGLAAGTALQGTSGLVDNEVGAGKRQPLHYKSHPLQNLLLLFPHHVYSSSSRLYSSTSSPTYTTAIMNTAGGIIHDQAEADADTSLAQRAAIAVGGFINLPCMGASMATIITSRSRGSL